MSAKVRGSGPRNGFPNYVIKSLRLDRIGVFSGVVMRHHKVGEGEEVVDPLWLLDPPTPWSIPCVGAQATIENSVCTISFAYEGTAGGGNVTFEPKDDQIVYELDASMAQEPIETHPSFSRLKVLYNWSDDERRFSQFLSTALGTGQGQSLPGNNGEPKKQTANPLFGTDSWLVAGCIFRKTYATSHMPANMLDNIGAIVVRPPDAKQFKLLGKVGARNWLRLAPKITRRGNILEITEEWMLSGPRGWLTQVYSAGQLNGLQKK